MSEALTIQTLKRGKTRGASPRRREKELNENWRFDAWMASAFPNTLITPAQAGDVLNIVPDSVRRIIREGKLKASKKVNHHAIRYEDAWNYQFKLRAANGGRA